MADYQLTFTDTTKAPIVVKPYTANGPKQPGSPTPLFAGAVSANSSLVFLGKGAFDYGEPVQQKFLHLLENFANRTRPAYPVQGQLWYKNTTVGDPSYPSDPSSVGLYVYTGTIWAQVLMTNTASQTQLNAGDFRVINVGDATEPTDAINQRTGDSRYVNVDGDTMTGVLNMSSSRIVNVGDAIDSHDAVGKAFGDSRYVQVLGGGMLGDLTMNNNKIANVMDATNPQDALNLRTAKNLFILAGAGGAVDGGVF